MRVLVGHIYHESNTFCPEMTRLNQFECFTGDDVKRFLPGADVLEAAGAEVIGTVYAQRWSSGTVEKAAFGHFLRLLIEKAREEKDRLDGVFLSLHGGMTVEEIGSGEYAVLEALRKEIGYGIPVAVSMDMHANQKDGIERFANVITGYHTAPHTDAEETQRKAARALLRLMESGRRPHPQIVRLPMLLVGERALSKDEPFRTLFARCKALEADGRVLAATVFVGMAWSDTPHTAASVCVSPSAPEYAPFALDEARALAKALFDRREECPWAHPAFEPEEAVRRALSGRLPPLFLSDSGDNPTAGGTGESTVLLRLILRAAPEKKVLFAPIVDPEGFARASRMPEGALFPITVGSRRENWCESVTLDAFLLRVCEIVSLHGGSTVSLGKAAVLRSGNIELVLAERQMSFTGPECFASAGLDVSGYDVVVLKMGYVFAEIAHLCRENLMALTPGITPLMVTPEQYRHLTRPIWPLDRDAEMNSF